VAAALSFFSVAPNGEGAKLKYHNKVLQSGESVKFVGKLHWIIYKRAIFFLILSLVLFSAIEITEDYKMVILTATGITTLLAITSFLRSWFVRATTEIVVTDRRIIHKTGWLARHTEEMNMTKVETVDVRQNMIGRILDYGAVLIKGIGGSWEPILYVASPLGLRNAILVG
jgi:uncharacterized membrane protein YdbT with pleckstrin-like domain